MAFALALAAAVLGWVVTYAGPWSARQAAAKGNYDNLYTFSAVGWGIVVALYLVAIILGIMAMRRPTGKALAGAAVGIAIIGVLGFLVNVIVSTQMAPALY